MTGFLTGAAAALLLAMATWVGLNAFTVTSIERVQNPSLNLHGLAPGYTPNDPGQPDG